MMRKSHKARGLVAATGLVLLLAVCRAPAGAPLAQQTDTRPDYRSGGILDSPIDKDPVLAARRLKALNIARQKKLVEDTNRLVELARELDTEVQAGNQEGLTAAQNAKLALIEKLAHQVKDKMIESDADLPWMNSPYTTIER